LLAGLDRLLAIAADPLFPQSLGARSASKGVGISPLLALRAPDETTAKASGTPHWQTSLASGTRSKEAASVDLCLKLGHIDNLLGRYAAALESFTLAGTVSRGVSSAQRSFASLGLARAIAGRSMAAAAAKPATDVSRKALAAGEPDPWLVTAKSLYQRSLKEYPTASWHDETLHELASLIERTAAQRFPPLTNPSPAGPAKVPPAKPVAAPTDAQRTERAKSLAAARAEALPYWLDLAKRFPKSRYAPQALYHVGLLATEANQPEEAIAAFADLIKNHPDSPWTPDAQVRLIDVKLEQQFDLPGAAALAASAVLWCEQNPAHQAPSLPASASPPEIATVPPDFDRPPADLPPIRDVQYNIYLRAGLIEYLQEHKGPALAFFEKAKPLQPARGFVVVQGEIPTGIERLASLAKSDSLPTPDAVRNGDQKAKLILMLADLYCDGEQHGKAIELCDRLIDGTAPKASRDQTSYAYFRRARGHYLIAGSASDPDAALADYVAAVGASPKAEWADSAIFFAANIEWNHKHNLGGAVSDWSRLLREHPKSKEADRCALYIGAAYFYSERYPEAQRALEGYLARYRNSEFVETGKRLLDECRAKINGRWPAKPAEPGAKQ
jgi:outer membrane protein assembly factor BamD (BamD/ComL family)